MIYSIRGEEQPLNTLQPNEDKDAAEKGRRL